MFRQSLFPLLFALFALNAHASDPFVGEWSSDSEMCAEMRFLWTADRVHGALSVEDGHWEEAITAPYEWDGSMMKYTVVLPTFDDSDPGESITERIRITMHGADRLTLENLEREAPDNTLDLVRCPPR